MSAGSALVPLAGARPPLLLEAGIVPRSTVTYAAVRAGSACNHARVPCAYGDAARQIARHLGLSRDSVGVDAGHVGHVGQLRALRRGQLGDDDVVTEKLRSAATDGRLERQVTRGYPSGPAQQHQNLLHQ